MSETTNWVQAISAVAGVVGLGFYAWDTRKIRNESLAQGAASRRPFIQATDKQSVMAQDGMRFVNFGVGPAIKLSWNWIDRPDIDHIHQLGAIAVNATFVGTFLSDLPLTAHHVRTHGVRFSYQDTAGKKYWTTITSNGEDLVVDTGDE